jgi:hypothetical protein
LSGRHRKIAADLHSLAPGIGRLAPHVNLGRSITHFDLTAWYVPNGEGSRLAEKRLSPIPIHATRRARSGHWIKMVSGKAFGRRSAVKPW